MINLVEVPSSTLITYPDMSTTHASFETNIELENYVLLEKIGEGGYGDVFRARQLNTGQTVAIKMLRNRDASLDDAAIRHQRARFERETQLCAEINHPHIVKLIDKGFTAEQEPYAAFEFVEGQTLKDLILQKNGLSATETSQLMGQVLDALSSAHAKGIIHRDLKPHNIMVTQTGARPYVKVLDFGIGAFASGYRSNDYRSLTLTQEVVGTPAYCAPEQLRGEPSTTRSDLYSWGLIVLECLTGQPVVQGSSVAELFQQQLNAANVPLPAAVAGHPLADLLRKVLEKNPRQRTSDSQKLLEEFSDINFNTLVGEVQATDSTVDQEGATLSNQLAWQGTQAENRQLTVLCLKLDLSVVEETALDMETLETIQRDQLHLCSDTAIRFGGYVAGTLANQVMVYFGYPNVSDNDARRAGRTALELFNEVKKRSALLLDQHGLRLDLRVSLHTGPILITGSEVPVGLTSNVAFQQLYQSAPDQILVSGSARKLLDPYLTFGEGLNLSVGTQEPILAYALTGERQTEALSFLRPRSAGQQMVGRTQEKAVLIDGWKTVTDHHGKALLVSGEAGIGKSRLIYEMKRYARDEQVMVRECRCFPEHQNNALYPFFEALKKSIGISGLESSEAAAEKLELALQQTEGSDVETLLPIFCSWLSLPLLEGYTLPELPPAEQKLLLMAALEELINHNHEGKPFLLIVEDLHWLDPTSREFVDQLLGHLEQAGCLVLMTARPEFEASWADGQVEVISLKELPHVEVHHVVQNILGEVAATAATLKYIADRTDGIPLFIEELTHMLLDRGYLENRSGQYELLQELDEKRIPVTLKDLLQARLDHLSLAKETAQVAATIGREFDYELLVKASLRDEAQVQSDLEQLLGSDLVYRHRRVEGEQYIFRHALIADAAYDSLTSSNRKEVHGRVAVALENSFLDRVHENPFELASHLARAEYFEKAVDVGLQATERQVNKASNQEARQALQSIDDWIPKMDDQMDQRLKQLKANQLKFPVLLNTEGFGTANFPLIHEENQELIAHLSTNQPDEEQVEFFEKVTLMGQYFSLNQLHLSNQREKAWQLAEQLLPKIEQDKEYRMKMVTLATIGQMYLTEGKWSESEELLNQVISLGEEKEDYFLYTILGFDPVVVSYGNLACINFLRGELQEAKENAVAGVEYGLKVNTPNDVTMGYLMQGLVLGLFGESEWVEQSVHEFKTNHSHQLQASFMAIYYTFVDDWSVRATDTSKKSRQTLIDYGQVAVLVWYELLLVDTLIEQDKYQEAQDLLQELETRCKEQNETILLSMILSLKGFCQSQIEKEWSEVLFKEAEERALELGSDWLSFQSHCYKALALQQYHENQARGLWLEELKDSHFQHTALYRRTASFLDG